MAKDIRSFQVFIASPSGLSVERRRFRRTLSMYNEDEAVQRGVSFWPAGWEDTLAGVGRPQSLINEDVRQSDYMVLVLWDRWGSPPTAGSGAFSSGTEEEYNIARTCLSDPAKPMRGIVVLFKGVSERHLSDPGEQLRRVLAFRQRIEQEKQLLYQTFDTEDEFARIVQRHMAQWVRDHESHRPKPAGLPSVPIPEGSAIDLVTGTGNSPEALVADAEARDAEGRLAEAEALFAKAVVGSRSVAARLKYARFLRHHDRLAHAKANYEAALELANGEGDVRSAVEALANLGVIARREKDLKTAEDRLAKALEMIPASGDDWNVLRSFVLGNMAHAYSDRGDADRAEQLQRDALRSMTFEGHEEETANGFGTLGVILRRNKRWAEAETAHREGIKLSEQLEEKGTRTLAYNCGSLGLVLERTGRHEEAIAMHTRALSANEKMLRDEGIALNLGHLAEALVSVGRDKEAEERNEAAFQINTRRSNAEGVAYNCSTKGRISELRGDLEQAAQHYQSAQTLFRQAKNLPGVAHNMRNLARVLAKSGSVSEADVIRRQAEEVALHAGDLDLVADIRQEWATVVPGETSDAKGA